MFIESCLKAAYSEMLDEPLVEISYRGVTVGTVIANRLKHEREAVAKWIIECYRAVAPALES